MFYKNKVIWVTGASSGVGEALVYAFDKASAQIIISARRQSELERVKSNCTQDPNRIFVLPLDLEDHDSIPEKSNTALKKFGKIDILFNNGGVSQRSFAKDTKVEVDKKIMNINYFGAMILTKAVLPSMIKNKSGHIAVMSSLTGKFGVPLRSAYAASKHALHGFFDTLRAEVFKDNIKVTIICSGYIKTNIAVNALTEKGNSKNEKDPDIENGLTPEFFTEKALKAIEKGKEELLLGGKEKFGVYLKRFTPCLFSKIIRKKRVQ